MWKKIYLLLFIFSPALKANIADSLYINANECYQEGKYEEAQDIYLEIINKGLYSSEVYYNLGNTYFRLNQAGKARLYYEKALILSPRDQAIQTNLALTIAQLQDKFETVPVFFLRKWIIALRKSLLPNTWSLLSLILFIVAFVFLVIFLFSKTLFWKKFGFYTGFSLFIISVITLIFAYFASKYFKDSGTAILTQPSVIVRSAPRETGKELFVIHEGAKVWLQSTLGDWQEIKISDGRIGWLPSDVIEKI